jgi:lysophospholipase L1-like esterase
MSWLQQTTKLALGLLSLAVVSASAAERAAATDWIEPMRQAHARFSGTKGTLAQFGDSITFSMAFWAPLAGEPKNMSADARRAHAGVKNFMKPECWREWKGPEFGNEGSMTIRWADQNVDKWLTKLNPGVAVIMFGSNDVGQMDAEEYERKTRAVVQRCLKNGTVVLLTTAPPRSGHLEKSKQFAEAVRKIAREEKVPLIDYFGEILKRRADDWDGSLAQFKFVPGDIYEVPTLIARDGVHPSNTKQFANDFSEAGLSRNGFTLRNYLTLIAYSEVIEKVLRAK